MSYLEHLAVLGILAIALGVGLDVASRLGGPVPAVTFAVTLVLGYIVCVIGFHPFRQE